mmetsp:Transcript_10367/g.42152  ORF Transcript_10367/g.42152 Transcript_10367/m.42152 type:complete len:904 (+) Transcript_10367:3040-5751(+)
MLRRDNVQAVVLASRAVGKIPRGGARAVDGGAVNEVRVDERHVGVPPLDEDLGATGSVSPDKVAAGLQVAARNDKVAGGRARGDRARVLGVIAVSGVTDEGVQVEHHVGGLAVADVARRKAHGEAHGLSAVDGLKVHSVLARSGSNLVVVADGLGAGEERNVGDVDVGLGGRDLVLDGQVQVLVGGARELLRDATDTDVVAALLVLARVQEHGAAVKVVVIVELDLDVAVGGGAVVNTARVGVASNRGTRASREVGTEPGLNVAADRADLNLKSGALKNVDSLVEVLLVLVREHNLGDHLGVLESLDGGLVVVQRQGEVQARRVGDVEVEAATLERARSKLQSVNGAPAVGASGLARPASAVVAPHGKADALGGCNVGVKRDVHVDVLIVRESVVVALLRGQVDDVAVVAEAVAVHGKLARVNSVAVEVVGGALTVASTSDRLGQENLVVSVGEDESLHVVASSALDLNAEEVLASDKLLDQARALARKNVEEAASGVTNASCNVGTEAHVIAGAASKITVVHPGGDRGVGNVGNLEAEPVRVVALEVSTVVVLDVGSSHVDAVVLESARATEVEVLVISLEHIVQGQKSRCLVDEYLELVLRQSCNRTGAEVEDGVVDGNVPVALEELARRNLHGAAAVRARGRACVLPAVAALVARVERLVGAREVARVGAEEHEHLNETASVIVVRAEEVQDKRLVVIKVVVVSGNDVVVVPLTLETVDVVAVGQAQEAAGSNEGHSLRGVVRNLDNQRLGDLSDPEADRGGCLVATDVAHGDEPAATVERAAVGHKEATVSRAIDRVVGAARVLVARLSGVRELKGRRVTLDVHDGRPAGEVGLHAQATLLSGVSSHVDEERDEVVGLRGGVVQRVLLRILVRVDDRRKVDRVNKSLLVQASGASAPLE